MSPVTPMQTRNTPPRPSEAFAPNGFAFDLDGTIYLQSRLLPGAAELLGQLRAAGIPYLFATNNSSTTGRAYVERLTAMGIPAPRESVVTSNDVAADYLLREGHTSPFILATPEVLEEYRERGFTPTATEPDSVLLTFDTTLDYGKLRRASDLILAGLPYFATHPDLVCPTLDGPIPDCGAFIELLAASTGRRPVVLGKPEPHMAHTITDRLGVPPAEIAFVGDRLYTDMRMANENGFLAVLTLTGEAGVEDLRDSPYRPDLIVDTLEQLLERLGPAAPGDGPPEARRG